MSDASEGETAWARMTRRKVVQWGIAYAAGAWGLQQGLAYVSTLLNWPAQLQKLAGLALLIGLPVVLVLAWYHGDRGEQRVTRTEFAILTLLFLFGGGLFWRYQQTTESTSTAAVIARSATTTATASPDSADSRPSIAVLPFTNLTGDPGQEIVADGLAEEVANQLAAIPELRVTGRRSSFSFKDKNEDLRVIANKLDVANLLEGTLRADGTRLRVTVQLIDGRDGTRRWSSRPYEHEQSGCCRAG